MLKAAQEIAGGLEQGLEQGVWGGVKGAMLGYMTFPVVAGLIAAGVVVAMATPVWGLGPFLGPLAAGLATTAVASVIGYPINARIAEFGSVLGGVLGFTHKVDDVDPEKGQIIQLAPDQELVVVNKPSVSAAEMNAFVASEATQQPAAATMVQADEAKLFGRQAVEAEAAPEHSK